MKHIISKNYRNPELLKKLLDELKELNVDLKIMEVCGSHTMAIGHWGLRKILPENCRLISGPGCPVCVTPSALIDSVMELKGKTIASFGDLLRVPGKEKTLEQARAEGLDVRIIYSPLEALKLAEENETIFIGIGFETTIPGIAHTIKLAKEKNLKNFSVLGSFKTVPNALDVLLSSGEVELDGFLLPGHVSAIIGTLPYKALVEKHNIGGIITGFEPVDIVAAIKEIAIQKKNGKYTVKNMFKRVVNEWGNPKAQETIAEVMEPVDALWRGIGVIPNSGLKLRKKYEEFDAAIKYSIDYEKWENPSGCKCGEVLKGKILPPECGMFGKTCVPANPLGPCMVSSEGSCAAYYRYER